MIYKSIDDVWPSDADLMHGVPKAPKVYRGKKRGRPKKMPPNLAFQPVKDRQNRPLQKAVKNCTYEWAKYQLETMPMAFDRYYTLGELQDLLSDLSLLHIKIHRAIHVEMRRCGLEVTE